MIKNIVENRSRDSFLVNSHSRKSYNPNCFSFLGFTTSTIYIYKYLLCNFCAQNHLFEAANPATLVATLTRSNIEVRRTKSRSELPPLRT